MNTSDDRRDDDRHVDNRLVDNRLSDNRQVAVERNGYGHTSAGLDARGRILAPYPFPEAEHAIEAALDVMHQHPWCVIPSSLAV